jgi:hypothetical protein
MIRTIFAVAAAGFAGLLVPPAWGDEKPKDASKAQAFCDVYGPGYEALAGTNVCIKIGGSIEVGVSSGSRNGSVVRSADWLTTKAAPTRN